MCVYCIARLNYYTAHKFEWDVWKFFHIFTHNFWTHWPIWLIFYPKLFLRFYIKLCKNERSLSRFRAVITISTDRQMDRQTDRRTSLNRLKIHPWSRICILYGVSDRYFDALHTEWQTDIYPHHIWWRV